MIVDMKGKPYETPSEAAADTVHALRTLFETLRDAAAKNPSAFRAAFNEGGGVKHLFRRIRVDMEYIERVVR